MNEMRRIEADELSFVPSPPAKRGLRLNGRLIAMLSLPLLLLAVGAWFWLTSGRTVSTDNAYVGAHVVNVSPEMGGRITEVAVTENQRVKAGDLLYRIDPEPYRIALMEADAALGEARLQISQMRSGYSEKVADIGEKVSDVQLAQENFQRQQDLLAKGFTTRANYDAARAALSAAVAQRSSAAAAAESARAMLGTGGTGGHPQVEAAAAARAKAALNLARTEVRAPIDGVVAQSDKLTVGSLAVQMLSNVSVVGAGDYWIDANFKETQLAKIRIGQPAEVEIDAIPDRSFKARVTGIGAGTGSEFSLLPAQNATGNWVKVTQRVPVRLKLEETPDRPLVSGWSAHVTVKVAD
jgi:membrane fusion protein (multidrug efflux system)